MPEDITSATCGSSLHGAGGISPTASLAPADLSQSNVEGNQLKHIPRDAPTEDLVPLGQQLEAVQDCHSPDVVYAILDNNGLSGPPSHCFPFQGKCFADANWHRSATCPWSPSPLPSIRCWEEQPPPGQEHSWTWTNVVGGDLSALAVSWLLPQNSASYGTPISKQTDCPRGFLW
jgi:hypothetical protein